MKKKIVNLAKKNIAFRYALIVLVAVGMFFEEAWMRLKVRSHRIVAYVSLAAILIYSLTPAAVPVIAYADDIDTPNLVESVSRISEEAQESEPTDLETVKEILESIGAEEQGEGPVTDEADPVEENPVKNTDITENNKTVSENDIEDPASTDDQDVSDNEAEDVSTDNIETPDITEYEDVSAGETRDISSGETESISAGDPSDISSDDTSGSDVSGAESITDVSSSDVSGTDISGDDAVGIDQISSDVTAGDVSSSDMNIADVSEDDISENDLSLEDVSASDISGNESTVKDTEAPDITITKSVYQDGKVILNVTIKDPEPDATGIKGLNAFINGERVTPSGLKYTDNEVTFRLSPDKAGTNTVEIETCDKAGNLTKASLKVEVEKEYSPLSVITPDHVSLHIDPWQISSLDQIRSEVFEIVNNSDYEITLTYSKILLKIDHTVPEGMGLTKDATLVLDVLDDGRWVELNEGVSTDVLKLTIPSKGSLKFCIKGSLTDGSESLWKASDINVRLNTEYTSELVETVSIDPEIVKETESEKAEEIESTEESLEEELEGLTTSEKTCAAIDLIDSDEEEPDDEELPVIPEKEEIDVLTDISGNERKSDNTGLPESPDREENPNETDISGQTGIIGQTDVSGQPETEV